MIKKSFLYASYFFFGLFILLVAFFIYQSVSPHIFISTNGSLLFYAMSATLLLLSTMARWFGLMESKRNRTKMIQFFLWAAFAVYLFLLLDLLFIGYYGRAFSLTERVFSLAEYKRQWQWNTNLVPFKTIQLYLTDGGRYLNPGIAFTNLVGNLLAFTPMGFFCPLLIKKLTTYKAFILFAIGAPLLAEIVQFIFLVGSFDVDDILLNAVGAILTFCFVKILRIEQYLQKFYTKKETK